MLHKGRIKQMSFHDNREIEIKNISLANIHLPSLLNVAPTDLLLVLSFSKQQCCWQDDLNLTVMDPYRYNQLP